MTITPTAIPDVCVITPRVREDTRGYFIETYSEQRYRDAGIACAFVQDNESCSMKGVLRGFHYQRPPFAQAKLVRVLRGAVLDVAVDIRRGSPTFGQHVAACLSAENKQQLFIPHGFAHGFLVLEDNTIFSYKCDDYYSPQHECGIRWDDPTLAVQWPRLDVAFVLSAKDERQPFLSDAVLFEC
ncbi:MAG: dTDP-4-dehydrorhamnose 3,5-epimerase [Kiritimatiellaeota bacterium]|nr:dTDP-4-dehydrorhamnose 3,5-epimerase [Kiritimatiellota bacterium]